MADNRPLPSSSQAGLIGGEPGLCCVLNVRAAPGVRLERGADAANPYPPHERGITHPRSLKRHHEAARRDKVVAPDPDAAFAIAFRDSLNSDALMQGVLQGNSPMRRNSSEKAAGVDSRYNARG